MSGGLAGASFQRDFLHPASALVARLDFHVTKDGEEDSEPDEVLSAEADGAAGADRIFLGRAVAEKCDANRPARRNGSALAAGFSPHGFPGTLDFKALYGIGILKSCAQVALHRVAHR